MTDSAATIDTRSDRHGPSGTRDPDAGCSLGVPSVPSHGRMAKGVALAELAVTLSLLPVAVAGILGLGACGLGLVEPSAFFEVWWVLTVCAVPLPGVLHRRLLRFFQRC